MLPALSILLLSWLLSVAASGNRGQGYSSASALAQKEEEKEDSTVVDFLEEDEVQTFILSCNALSEGDPEIKGFLMENMNMASKQTLDDLKVPMCRAAFDMACGHLTRSQMAQLMAQPEGMEILNAGQCLEAFNDFSDFSLETFAKFPNLKLSSIQQWSSINPEVLLALINSAHFTSIGRVESFPARVGIDALFSSLWIHHPQMWQLFLLEGVRYLPSTHKQAYVTFLASSQRIDSFIASRQEISSKTWDNIANPATCDALNRNAAIVTRWAIQSEEFIVNLLDDTASRSAGHLATLIDPLLNARIRIQSKVNACYKEGLHKERMIMLKRFLSYPITWRMRRALVGHQEGREPANASTMTLHLYRTLAHLPRLAAFYANSLSEAASFSFAHMLSYFLELNGVRDLEEIYGQGAVFAAGEDERILLSISIRRLLLMLQTPPNHIDSIIQDALSYVLKAPDSVSSSSLLHLSDNEALYWFQQARDMLSLPVLDRLIVTFGHEFNVAHQIEELMKDRNLRQLLFEKSESSLVRLLAALKHSHGSASNRVYNLPYVAPELAFIDPEKPENNEEIKTALQGTIDLMREFSASSQALAPFLHPKFAVKFQGNEGIDAGGLRKSWISTVSRFFSDPSRELFVQVDELPGTGLLPTPFIDPEMMKFLGLVQGKALQIGITAGWFFLPPLADIIFDGGLEDATVVVSSSPIRAADRELYSDDQETLIHDEPSTSPEMSQATMAASTNSSPVGQAQILPSSPSPSVIATLSNRFERLVELIPALYPEIFFSLSRMIDELSEEDALDYFNDTGYPTIEALDGRRQSFSTAFLFNLKFWRTTWPDRPKITVDSKQAIIEYRSALINYIANNLHAGIEAYRQSLALFFEPSYLKAVSPEELVNWLSPRSVTIEEIFETIRFDGNSQTIMVIDDEGLEPVESESVEADSELGYKPADTTSATLKLITAKEVFRRVAFDYFKTPASVEAFLSFVRGSPQLPPTGLEGLAIRLSARLATVSPYSKSHTCSELIDFVVSERFSTTKKGFIEGFEGMAGFGMA